MFGSRLCAVAVTAALLTLGFSGQVGAAGGGGKPRPVAEANLVFIVFDEKVGTQYSAVSGLKFSMAKTGLPVTAKFDMCNSVGSLINPGARPGRGLRAQCGVCVRTLQPEQAAKLRRMS
jgi:hypothetical protein